MKTGLCSRISARMPLTLVALIMLLHSPAGATEFEPGDQVRLIRDEDLLFRGSLFRRGSRGEKLRVLQHRADQRLVFLAEKDDSGNQIAVSIPEGAIVRSGEPSLKLPPSKGRTLAIQGRRFENAQIESISGETVMLEHAGGVTALHRGVVPQQLFDDYSALQALRKAGPLGLSAMDYQRLFPGLAFAKTGEGEVYLKRQTKTETVTVDMKGAQPVQARFICVAPISISRLEGLLSVHSRGQRWTEVQPLLNIQREFERADGKVSATLIADSALIIRANGVKLASDEAGAE
jgi:hypothetical protein